MLCTILIFGIRIYNQNPKVILNKAIANFDRMVMNIERINAKTVDGAEKDNLQDEIHTLLQKLGLSNYNDKVVINKEFVDKYLEKHTKEEFLENTIKLCVFLRSKDFYLSFAGNIRSESWHVIHETDCRCQKLTILLNHAFAINNIEIKGVTSDMAGTTGYYTENPNAEPIAFEETHSGRFYDKDGTNGRYESKTDTGVVTYYGDYAILSITRYAYQEGQYGWKNGIFYDELPFWETIRICKLYYKGKFIQEADSAWELLNGKNCIIDINGTMYEIGQINVRTETYAGYADTHTFMDIRKYE